MSIRKINHRKIFSNKQNEVSNTANMSNKVKDPKGESGQSQASLNIKNGVISEEQQKCQNEYENCDSNLLKRKEADQEKKPQSQENIGKSKGLIRRKKKIAPKKPSYPQIQLRGDSVVEVDLEDDKVKHIVSPRIELDEIFYNIDTKEIGMCLNFDYCGESHSMQIDRSYFTKKKLITLQRYGVGVYDFNANNVIKHLVNQEILAKKSYIHSQIGMVKDEDGNYIFRHHKAEEKDFTSTYSGDLKLEPKGTREKKIKMIEEYVLGRTPLEAIMAVGFSSALVGMISEDTEIDNPIIHVSGDSTTGKSTALMLAASLYGSPNPKERGIFDTWNGTKNAILAKLRDNHGIIAVFDEASMSNITDFSDIIYMFAAGSDKQRLSKDAEVKDTKEWNTTIVSSGEYSLDSKINENTGLNMRKIEFINIEWTESAEHSDEIKKEVLQNYGHLGVKFGKALVDIGKDEVIKCFRHWVDKCYNNMNKEDKFAKRLSKPMALIMTSADIARNKLGIDLNLQSILEFLIKTQTSSKKSNDIGMRAYEYFLDMYTINRAKFLSSDDSNKDKLISNIIWGKHIHKSGSSDEIVIMTSVLKDILKEGGFEDMNVVLNKWRDNGILDCDANRYTRKRSIGGSPKRVHVVRVMDNFFSKEENDEANKEEHIIKNVRKKPSKNTKLSKLFCDESA